MIFSGFGKFTCCVLFVTFIAIEEANTKPQLIPRKNRSPQQCGICDNEEVVPLPLPNPGPGLSPSNSKQVDLLNIVESCAANFITQDYSDGWEERRFGYTDEGSLTWHIRLTNKLFVYLMSFNMYQSNGMDITEGQLEQSACFQTKLINNWGITNTTGFGGKSALLRLSRTNLPKVFRFALPYGPIGASAGTASIILSDNFSYNVFELCFDNGFRTFAMFTKGVITPTDLSSVRLHLKAIGFQGKHIIDLQPDENCFAPLLIDPEFLIPKTTTPRPTPPNTNYLHFIGNNALLPLPPFFWKKK